MILITPRSLPGITFEENRNVSPSFIDRPRYLPRLSCAVAARRSPCEPVTISIRFWRGTSTASSGWIVPGKPLRTLASSATCTILRMARPKRQTERPAARPASARVFSRATFEAKVVATTIPFCEAMKSRKGATSVDSERPGLWVKTFVESQHRTLTPAPSLAISCHSSGSKGSPTTGLPSSLKSPVCTTRPAGVSMMSAELSGIEWLTGTNCTRNGPTSIAFGRGSTTRIMSAARPASSIFIATSAAVKRRAKTGARSFGHRCGMAPIWSSWPWVRKIASMRLTFASSQAVSAMIRSTPGAPSMSGKVTPRSTTISRSFPSGP